MKNQASSVKTVSIVNMDDNLMVEFSDDKGNFLQLKKEKIEELRGNIEKIFTYFEVAKTLEEIKIEELEKENVELKKILGTVTNEVGALWN